MLEMLLGPKRAERHPWEMFIIGIVYASLAILLVSWIFGGDAVLAKYSGILIVTFCVMFSLPFVYYIIKLEEEKDLQKTGFLRLLEEHSKALKALTWLFLGFVVAFAFWYMVLPHSQNFRAQIETYCWINRPANFDNCINEYGVGQETSTTTTFATSKERIFKIFSNNIYVMIFTLIFSLIFGAGAIFILAWNASVIAAAIGIFTQSKLSHLPIGLARYMIHGLPEIVSYFVAALAGGILSIAIIRHDFKGDKFWRILQDSLNLVIVAIILLFIAALIEVFITPIFF